MGVLVRNGLKVALPGGIGAAASYFLDPDRGAARRARAKLRVESVRGREGAGGAGACAGYEPAGRAAPGGEAAAAMSHIAAVQAVKQTLASSSAATEDVTVEFVSGLATLRGQVASDDDKCVIESEVVGTPGVREVRSLLHLPGVPPRARPRP